MEGALLNAQRNGFSPAGIVDIGANSGEWSRMARSVFPDCPIAMFDGNPRYQPVLAAAARELGKASHTIAVLGPQAKEQVVFYSSGPRSSVLVELTTLPRAAEQQPMRTLDESIGQTALGSPVPAGLLMKLDVQGFELEVLRGGMSTLSKAELLILETSLLPYNEGGPTFAEVVKFMDDAGFAAFDFCGQFRRQTDLALCQTDVAFVRRDSELRRPKKFFLDEP